MTSQSGIWFIFLLVHLCVGGLWLASIESGLQKAACGDPSTAIGSDQHPDFQGNVVTGEYHVCQKQTRCGGDRKIVAVQGSDCARRAPLGSCSHSELDRDGVKFTTICKMSGINMDQPWQTSMLDMQWRNCLQQVEGLSQWIRLPFHISLAGYSANGARKQ